MFTKEEQQEAYKKSAEVKVYILVQILKIIDIASARGAFQANELSHIGTIYDSINSGVEKAMIYAKDEIVQKSTVQKSTQKTEGFTKEYLVQRPVQHYQEPIQPRYQEPIQNYQEPASRPQNIQSMPPQLPQFANEPRLQSLSVEQLRQGTYQITDNQLPTINVNELKNKQDDVDKKYHELQEELKQIYEPNKRIFKKKPNEPQNDQYNDSREIII